MVDIDIGDYELDQDSNGDLVIKDPNDNEVMKWDKSNGQWDFGSETLANIRVEDVADTASGNTIYDSSSETLGDGNQDVNANSVSTDQADIGPFQSGQVTVSASSTTALDQARPEYTNGGYLPIIWTEGNSDGVIQWRINDGSNTQFQIEEVAGQSTTVNYEIIKVA